jgi:crotonobetainyl-CoA:carnitine CoA-transferase CaiB-like acyl-CoA transferase
VTALTASQAITAALLARSRTGEGQHVRLSMLDAIVSFLWSSDMGSQTYVGKDVSLQRAASFLDLIYETTDGYMAVSTMTNPQWQAFCRASGNPDWIDDPRFATTALRDLNIDARLELIQSAMITKSTDAWMEILDKAGVPCAPVLHRKQMINHPQVVANDIVREYEHEVAGRLRQARPAAQFSGTPPEITRGAPRLGEFTEDAMRALGYDEDTITKLAADGVIVGGANSQAAE